MQIKSINYLNLFLLLYVSTEYLEAVRGLYDDGFCTRCAFFCVKFHKFDGGLRNAKISGFGSLKINESQKNYTL